MWNVLACVKILVQAGASNRTTLPPPSRMLPIDTIIQIHRIRNSGHALMHREVLQELRNKDDIAYNAKIRVPFMVWKTHKDL